MESVPVEGESLLSHQDHALRSFDPKEELDHSIEGSQFFTRRHGLFRQHCRLITIHIAIFSFYTIAFMFVWNGAANRAASNNGFDYVISPDIGNRIPLQFVHGHSVYVDHPTDELDRAWQELLKNSNIRITEQEMDQLPGRKEQAIHLPDGGYFATMSVYHNLHCIKRLHHYMYQDHYWPNMTKEMRGHNAYHNNHCLEMLRQSIMCQGDTALLTMKWLPDKTVPTANFTSPHSCVNWESLETWATTRRIVHLMDPGYLDHPTLGPAYPGGHGDPIGELSKTKGFNASLSQLDELT